METKTTFTRQEIPAKQNTTSVNNGSTPSGQTNGSPHKVTTYTQLTLPLDFSRQHA